MNVNVVAHFFLGGGLKIFKPVRFLFTFVTDYGNESAQRKIKVKLNLKKNSTKNKFKPQDKNC